MLIYQNTTMVKINILASVLNRTRFKNKEIWNIENRKKAPFIELFKRVFSTGINLIAAVIFISDGMASINGIHEGVNHSNYLKNFTEYSHNI